VPLIEAPVARTLVQSLPMRLPTWKLRIISDDLKIWPRSSHDRREITGTELWMQRAALNSVGVLETRETWRHIVKFDRSFILSFFFSASEAHGDAHPEDLRSFQTALLLMDEITVVERLQSK